MKQSSAQMLGARLREDLPAPSDPATYAAQRSRLVQAAVSRQPSPLRYRLAAVAALAAVVLAIFAFRSASPKEPRTGLAFRAGTHAETGNVGAYYTPHDARVLPLAFSDGSRVSIQRGGGVRVTETRETKTSLLLETGSADFDIARRDGAEWEVLAGPYKVRVTGTAFRLSWDASRRALELAMREGSVVVTGPGIENGYRVEGQDRFVTQVTASVVPSVQSNEKTAANASTPPALAGESPTRTTKKTPASAPDRGSLAGAEGETGVSPSDAPKATTAPSAAPSPVEPAPVVAKQRAGGGPQERARAEGFETIVARAEQRGVAGMLATASATELRALADAARFTGRIALSQRTLRAVIARFPRTPDDAWASFVLGRLADQSGDAREAVAHYDRALQGGSLGAEALGRKMLSLQRLGETEQARNAARTYLERYPEGPYAPKARELAPN